MATRLRNHGNNDASAWLGASVGLASLVGLLMGFGSVAAWGLSSAEDFGTGYWHVAFPTLLVILYALFTLFNIICYTAESNDHGHFLADMRGGVVGRFLYVILFTPPIIGWICFIVSGINLRKFRKQQQGQLATNRRQGGQVRNRHIDDDDDDAWIETTLQRINGGPHQEPTPIRISSPAKTPTRVTGRGKIHQIRELTPAEEAYDLYVQWRRTGWKAFHKAEKARVARAIPDTETQLRELATRMQGLQRELNTLRAREKELKTVSVESVHLSDADLANEFERLSTLPGVVSVSVDRERIRLQVNVRHLHNNGKLYDFGDWYVYLDFDERVHIDTYEIRSGVKESWRDNRGGYPVYRLGGRRFCFGNQEAIINEHLRHGQFLMAAELAIAAMHNVNPEDQRHVPRAFHKVKE